MLCEAGKDAAETIAMDGRIKGTLTLFLKATLFLSGFRTVNHGNTFKMQVYIYIWVLVALFFKYFSCDFVVMFSHITLHS